MTFPYPVHGPYDLPFPSFYFYEQLPNSLSVVLCCTGFSTGVEPLAPSLVYHGDVYTYFRRVLEGLTEYRGIGVCRRQWSSPQLIDNALALFQHNNITASDTTHHTADERNTKENDEVWSDSRVERKSC